LMGIEPKEIKGISVLVNKVSTKLEKPGEYWFKFTPVIIASW